MSRLLLVSNRLPITIVRRPDDTLEVCPSMGGLASGLRGVRDRFSAAWAGWPGESVSADDLARLDPELKKQKLIPIALSSAEIEGYYDGVANSVIWPLFHNQVDRVPTSLPDWSFYAGVNRRFADAVAEAYKPGDLIWVHDYHLFLLPALLRARLPGARIGFFLHIPFPSSEVFGVLPWRREILEGLLGADLIGFHTPAYLQHFSSSLRRFLGLEIDVDRIMLGCHEAQVGVFPLGVDADAIRRLASSPAVLDEAAAHRRRPDDEKWLLAVDRLDYTKGIRRRLLAIDELLERHPEWREHIRFIQVTAPSREQVGAYALLRSEIDEIVGRVNSRWSTPSWSPVYHIHRAMTTEQLTALYLAADVMVVTPIRDGMNLVAKEFVAARAGGGGALVLSEMAGAASELPDAILVNPYDIGATADALDRALRMPPAEQHERIQRMASNVLVSTADRWAQRFLNRLAAPARSAVGSPAQSAPPPLPDRWERVIALLDYDGTLVPFAPTPDEAIPDDRLLALLASLTASGAAVHIVSGRPTAFLEKHFGELLVGLHAEHALWSRPASSSTWSRARIGDVRWRASVRRYLEHFTTSTPGSLLEEKELSFSWHFRGATQAYLDGTDFGDWQARELRLLLNEVLGNVPAQVLVGHKVVEVRPSTVNKGLAARVVPSEQELSVIAIGDDTTDEDLFAALPDSAITIKVGPGPSRARYRLSNVEEVRTYLAELAARLSSSRRSHHDSFESVSAREVPEGDWT